MKMGKRGARDQDREENLENVVVCGLTIDFPFPPYPSQLAVMSKVLRAIERRENALLESPTGTGKSLALLCSALAWQTQQKHEDVTTDEKEGPTTPSGLASSRAESSSIGSTSKQSTSPNDLPRLTAGGGAPKAGELMVVDDAKRSPVVSESDTSIDPDRDAFQAKLDRYTFQTGSHQTTRGGGVRRRDQRIHDRMTGAALTRKTSVDGGTPKVGPALGTSRDSPLPDAVSGTTNSCARAGDCTPVSRIYFASRTHSQISQLVGELRRTPYRPSMCVLGSRQHLCIHPRVSKGQLGNKNQACKKLIDEQRCRFFKQAQRLARCRDLRRDGVLNGCWDIEDLVALGESQGACPYYAARELSSDAELVFSPYNYLIDPVIRQSMDIDLKDAVVIIDEAHNIEDCARESAGFSVTLEDLDEAVEDVARLTRMSMDVFGAFNAAKDKMVEDGVESNAADGGRRKRKDDGKATVLEAHEDMLMVLSGFRDWAKKQRLTSSGYEEARGSWHGPAMIRQLEHCSVRTQTLPALGQSLKQVAQHAAGEGADSTSGSSSSSHGRAPKRKRVVRGPGAGAFESDDHTRPTGSGVGVSSATLGVLERLFLVLGRIFVAKEADGSPDTSKLGVGAGEVTSRSAPNLALGTAAAAYRLIVSEKATRGKGRSRSQTAALTRTLGLWCMDASVVFSPAAAESRCIVLTSGTLSPMHSFAAELGTSFPCRLEAPHVIDTATQALVGCVTHSYPSQAVRGGGMEWLANAGAHDNRIPSSTSTIKSSTNPGQHPALMLPPHVMAQPQPPSGLIALNGSYQSRESLSYQDAVGEAILSFAQAIPSGLLCFFPSYHILNKLLQRWAVTGLYGRLKRFKTICVEPRATSAAVGRATDGVSSGVPAGKSSWSNRSRRGRRGQHNDKQGQHNDKKGTEDEAELAMILNLSFDDMLARYYAAVERSLHLDGQKEIEKESGSNSATSSSSSVATMPTQSMWTNHFSHLGPPLGSSSLVPDGGLSRLSSLSTMSHNAMAVDALNDRIHTKLDSDGVGARNVNNDSFHVNHTGPVPQPQKFHEEAAPSSSTQQNGTGGAVLFAVCRGKVSEGLDFSNHNARGVIVVGIPFPNTQDLGVLLKREYNDSMHRQAHLSTATSVSGFRREPPLSGQAWYTLQAFRAVNQAVGRCLRWQKDYGAVLLLDERFARDAVIDSLSKWVREAMGTTRQAVRSLAQRHGPETTNSSGAFSLGLDACVAALRTFFAERNSTAPTDSTPAGSSASLPWAQLLNGVPERKSVLRPFPVRDAGTTTPVSERSSPHRPQLEYPDHQPLLLEEAQSHKVPAKPSDAADQHTGTAASNHVRPGSCKTGCLSASAVETSPAESLQASSVEGHHIVQSKAGQQPVMHGTLITAREAPSAGSVVRSIGDAVNAPLPNGEALSRPKMSVDEGRHRGQRDALTLVEECALSTSQEAEWDEGLNAVDVGRSGDCGRDLPTGGPSATSHSLLEPFLSEGEWDEGLIAAIDAAGGGDRAARSHPTPPLLVSLVESSSVALEPPDQPPSQPGYPIHCRRCGLRVGTLKTKVEAGDVHAITPTQGQCRGHSTGAASEVNYSRYLTKFGPSTHPMITAWLGLNQSESGEGCSEVYRLDDGGTLGSSGSTWVSTALKPMPAGNSRSHSGSWCPTSGLVARPLGVGRELGKGGRVDGHRMVQDQADIPAGYLNTKYSGPNAGPGDLVALIRQRSALHNRSRVRPQSQAHGSGASAFPSALELASSATSAHGCGTGPHPPFPQHDAPVASYHGPGSRLPVIGVEDVGCVWVSSSAVYLGSAVGRAIPQTTPKTAPLNAPHTSFPTAPTEANGVGTRDVTMCAADQPQFPHYPSSGPPSLPRAPPKLAGQTAAATHGEAGRVGSGNGPPRTVPEGRAHDPDAHRGKPSGHPKGKPCNLSEVQPSFTHPGVKSSRPSPKLVDTVAVSEQGRSKPQQSCAAPTSTAPMSLKGSVGEAWDPGLDLDLGEWDADLMKGDDTDGHPETAASATPACPVEHEGAGGSGNSPSPVHHHDISTVSSTTADTFKGSSCALPSQQHASHAQAMPAPVLPAFEFEDDDILYVRATPVESSRDILPSPTGGAQ